MTFILFLIDRKVRRGVALGAAVAVCMVAGLSGCGSSSSSTTQTTTSGIKKRVLLSNQFSSALQLIDAQNDKFVTSLAINSPTRLLTRSIVTAVLDSSSNTVGLLDNPTEKFKQQPALPGGITDIALSSDGKTAYAALRNIGQLAIINVPDGSTTTVAIPSVTRLVLSPNNTRLLAFSDDPQSLPAGNNNFFYVVDTASHALKGVAAGAGAQPYSAVFNGSDNQAFILNCAAECGGTAATPSLQPVDLTNDLAPVLGAAIPLPAGAGATTGLLNGSNLFLAGTITPGTGSLVIFNTGTSAFSAVLTIPDGLHTRMTLTSNSRLYVGSTGCLPVPVTGGNQGCLAIFDTTKGVTQTAITMPTFNSFRTSFSVTGMQPISGRNVIYVVEGGELDIYDITTNALTPTQLDVVGVAIDVVQIDP
jgi:hypothetical protein